MSALFLLKPLSETFIVRRNWRAIIINLQTLSRKVPVILPVFKYT